MYQSYSYSLPRQYQTVEQPKTFPEDIECIIKGHSPDSGSLYISNVEAASNPVTLKRFRISAVLSCAKGYELKHPKSAVPHYRYIPTVDDEKCEISVHFDEAVTFIDSHLKKTNVLVHCIAGVSRSVSMVLAYFIKEHGMHYEQAYRLVKSKRKIIHPNDGFIRQLKKYSQKLKEPRGHIQKDRTDASPRSVEKSVSIDRQKDNIGVTFDRNMPDFKSAQLTAHKDMTPPKTVDRRGELYERYASSQLKTPLYKSFLNYSRNEPFQSLQHIPDPDASPHTQDAAFTPKAKPQLDHTRMERYDLVRTSTNYFTQSKPTLVNQRPYQKRYEDYGSMRLERTPIAAARPEAHLQLKMKLDENGKASPQTEQRSKDTDLFPRGEYFASRNNELNEKIEIIRKKYAEQREKLFSKYQSPKKDYTQQGTASLADERRRASLGQFNNRPSTSRPSDLQGKRYPLNRTQAKQHESFKRSSPLDSYSQLYSKRYQRVANFTLNQEESFSNKMDKSLRNSAYYDPTKREGDRFGVYGGYGSYSPYYKYAASYKRYY